METLLSRNTLRTTLLSVFILLISISTCFAEGGGGGGGVGGVASAPPASPHWPGSPHVSAVMPGH